MASRRLFCDLCNEEFALHSALITHKLSQHKVLLKQLKTSAIIANIFDFEDYVYSSDSDCEYRVVTRIERILKRKVRVKKETDWSDHGLSAPIDDQLVDYIDTSDVEIATKRDPIGRRLVQSFECFDCKRTYKSKTTLKKHISLVHSSSYPTGQLLPSNDERKSYHCKHCDETFLKRLHYDHHLVTLRGGKPFFCKVCQTGFDAKMELTLHKRNNEACSNPPKSRPYLCTYCGKYFERKDSLTVHTRIHTNDKPFTCSTCNKSFIMKSTLQEHMNTHLGVKPYACQVAGCGRRFGFASGLRQHMVNMHEPPTFKCPFCDRMFAKKVHMESHSRSHTGEKPYKCEHCPMMFRLMSSLRIHRRTHTGDRPFKCDICQKGFIKSYGLVVHRRNQKKCVPPATDGDHAKKTIHPNVTIEIMVVPND